MNQNRNKLMIASFLTLIAAGVGFATRGAAAPAWASQFNIDGGTFGSIMGAGFAGFGVFIFFGGMLVEKFGYKKLLVLAVILHMVSAAMLFVAPTMYEGWKEADTVTATAKVTDLLYWSVFLFAVCAGLYEAVINPLVGQLYPENQTHYLNILHAGWPGGLIIGGILAAAFQNDTAWITEIPWHYALSAYSIVLIVLLGMCIPEPFPDTVSQSQGEKASYSYGVLFSCFASIPFLFLILLHALIGYMELGVDSWQTRLMENLVENSVVVLIYTSFLMFALRFFAGPIVHRLNPIGLLFVSSVVAVLGLIWLGSEITSIVTIFAAATLYSLGKAFLWPTMLAVAGERYPQSGAIAMSALGAAGMLCVGFIGGEMIGAQQAMATTSYLKENHEDIYDDYKAADRTPYPSWMDNKLGVSVFEYQQLDAQKQQEAMDNEEHKDNASIKAAFDFGSRTSLTKTAMIPGAMAVGFFILLGYYKSIGGYKVLSLDDEGESEGGESTDGPSDVAANAGSAEGDGES
ncbi:MAG: hypothetical protein CMJ78_02085 [Planctomycetaceae bacterium]|nr:hypothetical protein [Planctomycetaceae bacterium]